MTTLIHDNISGKTLSSGNDDILNQAPKPSQQNFDFLKPSIQPLINGENSIQISMTQKIPCNPMVPFYNVYFVYLTLL